MAGAARGWDLARRIDQPTASTMPTTCAICHAPIEGPALTDDEAGGAFHPACAAERAPADLAAVLFALAAAVLVPTALLWAG